MQKNRICFVAVAFLIILLASCGEQKAIPERAQNIEGLTFIGRTELQYAQEFAIDRYEDGYSVIYTPESSYLLVPENGTEPEGLDEDIKIIHKPVQNVYLAATATMDFFDSLGCGGAVRFSGTKAEDWYIYYAKNAMENGDMLYAGKYREPDYELLLSEGCPLSIQSTMIGHSPDVKEKLEELGITVFVDYSSYEKNPLGRCEWVKVYGEMLDKQEEAVGLFDEQILLMPDKQTDTGKTAVYFYINNNGQAVTRRTGDYVTNMIKLAGGETVFKNLGDGQGSSSVTVEMEDFYSAAKDADFIIYNSTIGGEITTIDELISKNRLLADFKAVHNGDVWCTRNNLFQEIMKTGEIISDFNTIFADTAEENPPRYLHKVKGGDAVD